MLMSSSLVYFTKRSSSDERFLGSYLGFFSLTEFLNSYYQICFPMGQLYCGTRRGIPELLSDPLLYGLPLLFSLYHLLVIHEIYNLQIDTL